MSHPHNRPGSVGFATMAFFASPRGIAMNSTNEKYFVQPHLKLTEAAVISLLDAAIAKADQLGFHAAVSVADPSGLLLGFLRMPGAFLVSSELSQRKARCAAGMGIEPQTAEMVLSREDHRVRDGLLRSDDFTLIRGGLPLYWEGVLVGGIGVSGGSESQDSDCVTSAIESINGFHSSPQSE